MELEYELERAKLMKAAQGCDKDTLLGLLDEVCKLYYRQRLYVVRHMKGLPLTEEINVGR